MTGWSVLIILVCVTAIVCAGSAVLDKQKDVWKENTKNIKARIPFSLFQGSYQIDPKRWSLWTYYAEFDGQKAGFKTYADWKKYKRFRKKLEEAERADEELKKKAESVEATVKMYESIMGGYMPKEEKTPPAPPTTGSIAIKPKEKDNRTAVTMPVTMHSVAKTPYYVVGNGFELDSTYCPAGSIGYCTDSKKTYCKIGNDQWIETEDYLRERSNDLNALMNMAMQAEQTQSIINSVQMFNTATQYAYCGKGNKTKVPVVEPVRWW